MKKKYIFGLVALSSVAALASCAGTTTNNSSTDDGNNSNVNTDTSSLAINNAKWNYDSTNNVYYQIGVTYCATPTASQYETMGIYVPGKYFNATKNSDGTYTCTVNDSGTVGNYNATTAPIVIPVNTPGYSAQSAPTSYDYNSVSTFLNEGFIYAFPGIRGKANGSNYAGGAPWGVTDIKAAIRYYRYNDTYLPGDSEKMITFGMSGGGAQSALAGATGDSDLYTPYLNKIGAAMTDANGKTLSDAVYASMCWCPITSLDIADEAYEWNMGQFTTSGTRATGTFTKELSNDLAATYGEFVNKMGFKDEDGNALTLSETTDGIYTAGTYYDYIIKTIETSLNNFISDTTFPYTPSSGMGGGRGNRPSSVSTITTSTTYNTLEDYLASLNATETWINYDSSTKKATITSLEAFVKYVKVATKDVGAFDSLSTSAAENDVFGTLSNDKMHFDSYMADLLTKNDSDYSSLSGYSSSYKDAYNTAITTKDELDTTVANRVEMYNPMYYILPGYEGYNTSTLAKHWRIRTGITQGDTALTTETNLMLGLENNSTVKDVDFATVWGQAHVEAERTGSS